MIKFNHSFFQHLPVLAVTTEFTRSLYSSFHERRLTFDKISKILVPMQHITYIPIMMLARLNLYAQSFIYLAKHNTYMRNLEIIGLLFFWTWFLWLLSTIPLPQNRIAFFLSALLSSFVLHLQINLSHFAMCTEPSDQNEEFVRHQLRTTLDVQCPAWLDWFHGGLQFQTAHHLFPRVPRHNLRKLTAKVNEFCKIHDLKFNCMTFTQGNRHTIGHLRQIGNQINALFEVAKETY